MSENLDEFISYHVVSGELQARCAVEARSNRSVKLQQLGSSLTTFGYHRVALEIFRYLIKYNGDLSNYINAGIAATRCKKSDVALEILRDALEIWPQNESLSRQLYEILTIENNNNHIKEIKKTLFDSEYVSVRQNIIECSSLGLRDDLIKIFETLKNLNSFSLYNLSECLSIVKIGFPAALRHLPVAELVRAVPDNGEGFWRELVAAAYGDEAVPAVFIEYILSKIDPCFFNLLRKFIDSYDLGEIINVKFGGVSLKVKMSFVLIFRERVIKVVWCKDKYNLRRFSKEGQILEEISLPYIPKFIASLHHEHFFVQILNRVPGVPLANITGKLPHKVFRKIETRLQAIHAKGYIHGDLSPWNIIISENEASIIDFGESEKITEEGSLLDSRFLNNIKTYFYDE